MVLREGKYGKFYGCSTFPKCRNTMRYSEPEPERPEVVEPNHDVKWSPYQQAIFALAENYNQWPKRHLVVKAGAGSGKTTVGVEFAARLPRGLEVAFVAFNRVIAKTFASKLPANVEASTLHSRGLSNATNALGKLKVEGRKVFYIVKDLTDGMPFEQAEVVDQSVSSIVRLVSLLKANLMDPTAANLDYICDRWNVEVNGDRETIYEVTRIAYAKSLADLSTIDFDDMIHLSATGRVPCKQFDVLVIDETQDLNKANLEMVVRSVKPDGHIVAVGDENQSIYGFRGADTDAMPNMIERLNALVLPLSITYRVPKSGVALANTLVPELEAAEWAEEGILESVSEYRFLDMVKAGDLVLCRTNAPLVGPCFDLIRQGRKAVILGRDIGSGLISLVQKIQKKARVRSLDDTLDALAEYRRHEIAKLIQQGKELAADTLDDKVETIFALSSGCYTVADLERRIQNVFKDDAEGVTFSTVHKSKGGEADRVFILKPELMPHPKATASWEVAQEYNIMYVAWTRHKKALYFVGGLPLFEVPDPDRDEEELVLDSEEPDGTEGQDRESYADDQDRDSYTVTDEMTWTEHEAEQRFQNGVRQVMDDLEFKLAFAAQEREQEKEAFLSDPDYLAGEGRSGLDYLNGRDRTLPRFPKEGRFEDNIYRPSAWELIAAMPNYEPHVEKGQLVLTREIAPGHVVYVWTTIEPGSIARGTGDDSIKVARRDLNEKTGQYYWFKNPQDYVNRRVPKDCDTPEKAAAHLAAKVQAQVDAFTRKCPECGQVQMKCRAGNGKDARFWWKGTGNCRCRVEGGW